MERKHYDVIREMGFEGVDWIYLGQDSIHWLSSCEQSKDLSGSVQSGEISDELTYLELVVVFQNHYYKINIKKNSMV
jgi:hypothetical protein